MSTSGNSYDLTTFANAFKRAFIDDDKVDLFLFDSPLLDSIKVTDGFVGTDEERVRATSFMGGYGYGSLARPNESNLIRPRLEAKKFYARSMVDVESMASAMNDRGAFFELVARVKEDMRRAIQNGMSLALTKTNIDHELVLGVIATSGVATTATAGQYELTLTDLHKPNFHKKQIVSIEDGNTDLFEVTALTDALVTVDRLTGSQVPVAGDEIMLQGSDGNAFMGLPGVTAQSGTLYNVTIADGWKANVTDKNGAAITEHDLYNVLLDVHLEAGSQPDVIACGLDQYKKIAEFLANKRVLNDQSDAMGHSGLTLATDKGNIKVIWDRHIENDTIYFLNSKYMELRKRPLSGIVNAGGDILLPDYINDQDRYHIVYRCYGNFYLEPTYMAKLHNLAQ